MNRSDLLEAALDNLPEGVAVLGGDCDVVFWNRGAEAMTGHSRQDLVGQSVPAALEPLLRGFPFPPDRDLDAEPQTARRLLIRMRHKSGHGIAALAQVHSLCDGTGDRVGTAIVFHTVASAEALPRGQRGEGASAESLQADFEDRMELLFQDSAQIGLPFGVLWVIVDQARELRRTHGAGGCEAMLDKVERALAHGLRPGEELGRWGGDEFLVLSHERTMETLAAHAQVLAGLARTADFRWWGDRASLTVSIGAAQAEQDDTLAQLLERAQEAAVSSTRAGGNHITPASGGTSCLRS